MIATSSVSIVNVNDGATGATGPQGVSVTKVVEEYRLSNSSTELTGSGTGYTWSETKPDIPSGKYLWIRERTDLSNNTSSYGTAHCDIVISGLVYDVNQNTQSITSKVWQSDITNSINTYDGSTGAAIRDRVTQTEQDISGITTRVSDVETTTDGLGTRMTTAESNITQNANNITTKVSKDGVISSINQSAETIKISASKVNIEGAVTFSSFDSTLQNRLTTAESDASTAKSNASSAVSTANTASSNASSALTKVNNSIKSTTMHYLATSASSGVTTSTSGWTTTIQSITNDKPYLWTYQTITKINDTTSNTDPVISGVYGATGGKGDTGTGVTKVEQLYRTSNSTTAPAAPTSAVSSTSTSYNTWTLAMPTYNTSYPYYYICTQTTYDNGTVKWTTVSRSKALEDANSTANTANTNASNAVSTANTANTNASNAVSTANTANTNASNAVTTANQAKSKADSAASLLSTWTGDATLATTTINGGYIKTHTIESTHLATNAIMSQNYLRTDTSSPYSSTGAFLDLETGTLYMPNFGVNGTTGASYFNGTVNANAGKFGDDTSYWNIETVYDYNMQPHAALVGTGSPYLQTGNWQVSDNAVATRKYTSTSESAGNATYYKDSGSNTFYDVGMKIPTNFVAYSTSDSSVVKYNKAFYYGRKYTGNSVPSLDSDWTYFFSIDSGGNVITAGDVYEGGTKLSEKYAAISDVGSIYLPKTGGTITGNLTVNGSFTTNLQVQTNLGSTSSAQLTGAANAVVKPGVTGTLGVGNGGTGKSSWTANQIVYASASNTLSQLGSGTSGQILKSNGSSAPSWVNQSTLSVGSATKATQDGNGNVIVNTYMPIAGGQFTGAVYVPDEFSADSAQLGSLIVNGAARFTNDVFADTFTGNLVGTASNAVKVGNNLVIKLNGGSTEGTNLFTYNGSAAKTINITASSIGAQASGTYAGGISNGGAASKLAYLSGNEINFVSTASTPPYQVHFNWRNGYTNTQTGTSSDINYYFENYNGEYNHTTLYAAQLSGNAATATSFASAKSVTLTGDTTGTASSVAGWSVATTTTRLSTVGDKRSEETTPNSYANKLIFQGLKGKSTIGSPSNDTYSYLIGLRGWSDSSGGKAHELAFNDSGINHRSGSTTTWDAWEKLVTSANYTDYTVTKTGTGASGTWGINVTGSAAYLTTGRTLTIGSTGKTFNGSSDVSWTKAEISSDATTSANGWMSSDDKTKLNGIQAGAQVNTITGVKGGAETNYRTGNVNITASNIGLGNVTNNKQVKGLASGTTLGHLVSWGSDGYTVADSGLAATSVATKITLAGSDYSASSNTITITQANLQSAVQSTGLLLMTSAERSKLASIQVAEGGTIDFSGVTASAPLTATVSANKTVNITHNTSGVTAGTYRSVTVNTYGHVTAGTNPTTLSGYGITDAKIASGVITLGSNTITPLTASSTLDATKLIGTASISTTGNAATATTASKADKLTTGRTISLTGSITGSTTFDGSNNVTITTKPTNEYSIPGGKGVRIQYPSSAPVLISCQKMNASGRLILIGGGYGAGGTIRNDFTELVSPSADRFTWSILDSDDIGTSIEIMNNNNGDATLYIYTISSCTITEITQLTTAAQNRVLLNSSNYNSYSPTLTGTGASGTWGISISGNAATASKANIITTTNAIAKYSDTQGTFANSNVYIDSDGNVVIGSTDSSGNVSGAGNFKIGAKNDNYGIMPYANNWNQIGSGSLYWYRGYINHYYGQTSHVTNWDAGKNIGTAATASAAATRGSVYFYNTCAANGTQTKTLLDANSSATSNITITLPSSTGTLALTSSSITGNAATSTKWASAQTVYVALGTASKTTSIQGGSSSAVTLGVDGVLGVANGGTGAASFTANSVIMSGSSTTGAFTTRAVTNNTSASAVTANTNLITANTLAYWTGSSNLTTCKQGTFGTAATYSATTSVTSGSSALVTSGGVSSALGNYVTLSTAQTISGAKTFSAVTSITNTTASTSKSTGALKVSGGVGVSGQMSANTVMIGDAVSLVYDSSISALCFQFD